MIALKPHTASAPSVQTAACFTTFIVSFHSVEIAPLTSLYPADAYHLNREATDEYLLNAEKTDSYHLNAEEGDSYSL